MWLIWSCGVAIFPIAAAFVLDDGLPFPHLGDYGRGIGVWSAWAIGFAAMAYAMFHLRGESIRALVLAQMIGGIAFVLAHAMPSIDTYAYLGYGDQLIHGANPWIAAPVAAYDEITHDFTAVWGSNPPSCRYGPGFVLFESALIRVFDGSPVALLVIVQRIISLLAAAGITALLRGPNARYWALSPFVSYYFVLEAHNDVLFLLAIAAAARIRRPIVQGALIGFAGAIKIVALAAFVRKRRKGAILAFASAALVLVVLYAFEPLALHGDGLRTQLGAIANSAAFLVYRVSLTVFGPRADVNTAELGVAIALACISLCVRWSSRTAATFIILLCIAALPTFWPWYLGWALFASVMSSSRRTMRFIVLLCLCSFVNDLPYLGAFVFNTQVTWLFVFVSLALLVVCGIVPEIIVKPGDTGTIFWHARRLLASRTLHAR